MPIASMTKLLTATLTIRLLEIYNFDIDLSIAHYVPPHWKIDFEKNTAFITPRMLLLHMSGYSTSQSAFSWQGCKDQYAKGPKSIVNLYQYCNWNYSMLRYVCARVVNGASLYNTTNDEVINKKVSETFMDCLRQLVLTPIGINNVRSRDNPADSKPTLLYNTPGILEETQKGLLVKDYTYSPGAANIWLSVDEYATFLNALLNGHVVSKQNLANMYVSDKLNVWFEKIPGKYGTYYIHGGDWFEESGCGIGCAEQGMHGRFMDFRDWGVQAILMTNMLYYGLDFRSVMLKAFEASFA